MKCISLMIYYTDRDSWVKRGLAIYLDSESIEITGSMMDESGQSCEYSPFNSGENPAKLKAEVIFTVYATFKLTSPL